MARPLMLLLAGWFALALAWAVANPPFAAPDEHDHYVRALGVAEGQWAGSAADFRAGSGLERQSAWASENARRVVVPAGLAPPAQCYVLDPRADASCLERAGAPAARSLVTPVGNYQPAPYALPAALAGGAETPAAALRLGRIGVLLPAFALLAVGVAALGYGARSPLWLVGPLLAVTPTVFTSIGALNPSGWEVAAGVGFGAALLRALRAPAPPSVWAAVAVTGAALAVSKTSGVPWVFALVVLAIAAAGPRGAWEAVRARPAAAAAAGVIGVALLANRIWEAHEGPDMPLSFVNPRSALRGGFEQWGGAADELVAAFGYLEVAAPWWLVGLWALLVGAAVAAAARHERFGLACATAAAVLGPPLLYALVIRHTGFGLQGRHVLPVLAVLPLIAGVILGRRGGDPRLLVAAGLGTAFAHLAAWWFYARRSAVGTDGPWLFVDEAAWSPPGGYVLWIAVAVLGAGLLATGAVMAARASGRRAS